MSASSRARRRIAGSLAAACAALLLFAATASAEVRSGESTSALSDSGTPAEATLVRSTASYDTTSGAVTFTITTAAPPQERIGAEPNEIGLRAFLANPAGECSGSGILHGSPLLAIVSSYATPETFALRETTGGEVAEAATKTIAGTTTTLTFTSAALANTGFSCAEVTTANENAGGEGASVMVFPIAAPPPPPPSPPAPPASAPSAPPPPPTKLTIAKPKPLELTAGKRKTVKVKVTNPGTATSPQGSLTVKTAKGISVKPATQTVPALAPGASWTLSIEVKATAKAKKKTTLSLTATASGLSTTSPLVVKLKQ